MTRVTRGAADRDGPGRTGGLLVDFVKYRVQRGQGGSAMGVDVSTQKERERMAVRPWEVITRSEEFQAIAHNALERLGPVLASWEALAKSEEFKVFLETAVLSLEPIIGGLGGARSVSGV